MEPPTPTPDRTGTHRLTELPRRLLDEARARLPFLKTRVPKVSMPRPGTEPGLTEQPAGLSPATSEPASINCIDYAAHQLEVQEVTDVAGFLATHRPSWSQVRWIDIVGIQDVDTILAFANKYQLHPTGDRRRCHQRPASESGRLSGVVSPAGTTVCRRPANRTSTQRSSE